MKVLSLDLSTKTGWALLEDGKLLEYGQLHSKVEDFNVNDFPDRSPKYPYNIVTAANDMGQKVYELVTTKKPDRIVVENTVKGRNRHTQRVLEFIHKSVLDLFMKHDIKFKYMDPSEWRYAVSLRLSNDDKKNNKLVRSGKKRGKITAKHLSVRLANELFNLKLKIKDNDVADSLLLSYAFTLKNQNE